jgi:hypothetical protein
LIAPQRGKLDLMAQNGAEYGVRTKLVHIAGTLTAILGASWRQIKA